MADWTEYREKWEPHPKDDRVEVHTFKFKTKVEREAFAAGIDFVNDSSISAHPVGLPAKGGRAAPGLVVLVVTDSGHK